MVRSPWRQSGWSPVGSWVIACGRGNTVSAALGGHTTCFVYITTRSLGIHLFRSLAQLYLFTSAHRFHCARMFIVLSSFSFSCHRLVSLPHFCHLHHPHPFHFDRPIWYHFSIVFSLNQYTTFFPLSCYSPRVVITLSYSPFAFFPVIYSGDPGPTNFTVYKLNIRSILTDSHSAALFSLKDCHNVTILILFASPKPDQALQRACRIF